MLDEVRHIYISTSTNTARARWMGPGCLSGAANVPRLCHSVV
jgi:hypothetical protein